MIKGNNTVIDFSALPSGGLAVATSGTGSREIAFGNKLKRVSAAVVIDAFGFAVLEGPVADAAAPAAGG